MTLARPVVDKPRAKSHRADDPSTLAPSRASRARAHASALSNSTTIFISLVPGRNAPTSTTARLTTPKSPQISLACAGLIFPGKFSMDKNLVARSRALVAARLSSSMRTAPPPIGRRRSSSSEMSIRLVDWRCAPRRRAHARVVARAHRTRARTARIDRETRSRACARVHARWARDLSRVNEWSAR
jgi:hypothetical protein